MKKTIALLLGVLLALSLVACGGAASSAPAAPAPASSAPASSAPAQKAPESKAPATSATTSAAQSEDLGLTEAYMGVSSNNETICLGFNADGSFAVFVAMAADGEYVSLTGPATESGDDLVTITDEANELTLTFGVKALKNGNIEVDMGDLGTAEVAACEVQVVVDALQQIGAADSAAS